MQTENSNTVAQVCAKYKNAKLSKNKLYYAN